MNNKQKKQTLHYINFLLWTIAILSLVMSIILLTLCTYYNIPYDRVLYSFMAYNGFIGFLCMMFGVATVDVGEYD